MSLHPTELKVGDVFWESGQYGNAEMRVVTKPVKTDEKKWEWDAVHVPTGEPQHYVWNELFWKPGIYWEPAYVSGAFIRGETDDPGN